jgi:methyl-accepting chemotaxis protein
MLSRMKIGTRLALGYSVILLLLLVISGVALCSLVNVNKQVDSMANNKWPKAVVLRDIGNKINAVAVATDKAIILGDASETRKELDGIASERDQIDSALKKLGQSLTTDKGKASFKKVMDSQAAYLAQLNTVITLIEAGNKTEAGRLLHQKVWPLRNSYAESVGKLFDLQGKRISDSGKAIEKTCTEAVTSVILALVASLLAAISVGFFITRSITHPLQQAVRTNQRIADGDLSETIAVGRNDEIGELNQSAQLMVENLRGIVRHLTETSEQMASSSAELFSTSEEMATASEEVAAQAGSVATAGEEIVATSGEIARSCQQAAQGSKVASEVATGGAAVVMRSVAVMEKIAEKVNSSARTVDSLGDRSNEIGEIVGTIEDIADQTNLLALNAAIEAARAGEQGRGFAVVADEVRALAERTTKATKEIADMIKSIQSETKHAVTMMEEGVREVENGTSEASKSGSALQEILDQINAVTMQVSQIATATEQQTATTGEISNNIHQMNEAVQQTARGAHHSSEAASSLAKNAQALKQIVGRFRLAS